MQVDLCKAKRFVCNEGGWLGGGAQRFSEPSDRRERNSQAPNRTNEGAASLDSVGRNSWLLCRLSRLRAKPIPSPGSVTCVVELLAQFHKGTG